VLSTVYCAWIVLYLSAWRIYLISILHLMPSAFSSCSSIILTNG
jgi:hypothetical protein